MSHFSFSEGDGIQDIKSGEEFASAEDFNFEAFIGHLKDCIGELIGTCTEDGEIFWPCGDHFPGVVFGFWGYFFLRFWEGTLI